MIIYKTTNLINGKIYVGRDAKNNPNYLGSGKHYKRAEKKYGKENFRKAIIDSDEDFNELCAKEIFWVDFYDARNPIVGYNILPGGPAGGATRNGMKNSEEMNRKIGKANAIALTGKKLPSEHKKKISAATKGENNPMYGKHHSEETRQVLRIANSGKNNPMYGKNNPNAVAAMIAARIGKRLPEETKQKLRIASTGENNPQKRPEQRIATSIRTSGQNNPMSKTNKEKRRLRENK